MRFIVRASCSLLLALPCAAQTINPNQIRPATSNNQVLTTVTANQAPSWQPGGGGGVPVWPNIYYSAVAPNNGFTYASVIIGGVGYSVPIPSGCPGTFGSSTVLATNSTAIEFIDKGPFPFSGNTILCTLTFTSASSAATVTGAGGTASSGDRIDFYVPTADAGATLAGITAELAGTTGGGGGGGGSVTITSPNSTLSVGGSTSAPTLDINLAHTNTWSAAQFFGAFTSTGTVTLTNIAGAATYCVQVNAAGVLSNTGTGCLPPSSGIPQVVSGTSWGATINASNPVPRVFLPVASSSALGAAQCDGVTLTCPAGVFTVIAGAGGTVNSGGSYALPAYGSSPSTTVGPSNIKTDSTGNNLIVPGSITSGTGAVLFSALPTCNTALGPAIRSISDPAVTTWGSTASGTGTAGTTNELVFCDAGTGSGTWTVFAK